MSEQKAVVVKGWEQFRVLGHPIRQQVLELAACEPVTVKGMAATLDMPPTRLYRHVEALVGAGLVDVVEERKVRGVIERWYRTRTAGASVADLAVPDDSERLAAAQVRISLTPERARALMRQIVEMARRNVEPGGEMTLFSITVDRVD